MDLELIEESNKLTPNERLVFENLDQRMSLMEGMEKLLTKLEEDSELDKKFQHMTVYDFTQVMSGLYQKYYSKIKYPKESERRNIVSGKFKGYNKNYLLVFENENQETTICNIKYGVRFSKTSTKKLETIKPIDELTRVNLYELFHETNGKDSDFISELKEKKVSWKVSTVLDPISVLMSYPEISL
jgi:hypothetical protein